MVCLRALYTFSAGSLCSCDLHVTLCDINCCCDTDCSTEELQTFTMCLDIPPGWDHMYLQCGTTCTSSVGLHAKPPEVRHSTLLFLLHTLPPLMPIVRHWSNGELLFDIIWYIFSFLVLTFPPQPSSFSLPPPSSSNSPVCVSSDYFVQSLTTFRTERVTRDNTQLFCVFIDNCKSLTCLMYVVTWSCEEWVWEVFVWMTSNVLLSTASLLASNFYPSSRPGSYHVWPSPLCLPVQHWVCGSVPHAAWGCTHISQLLPLWTVLQGETWLCSFCDAFIELYAFCLVC